jgi:translation initiation factor IF-3
MSEVLVLNEQGGSLGRMSYRDAQALALNQNLDLVQINQNGEVQVFKIMDHGKFKYQQRKNKQVQHHTQLKEMNFKLRIGDHDQNIKINHIKEFLAKGDEVRITVTLKGREKSFPDLAKDKMNCILQALEGFGVVQEKKTSPSSIYALVRPDKAHGKKQNTAASNQP